MNKYLKNKKRFFVSNLKTKKKFLVFRVNSIFCKKFPKFFIFFYFFLSSFLFFSEISSLFLQKSFRLICGRLYFFIIKEFFFNFGILNRVEKYWYYTNNKLFNTPYQFLEHRYRCGTGLLIANSSSY